MSLRWYKVYKLNCMFSKPSCPVIKPSACLLQPCLPGVGSSCLVQQAQPEAIKAAISVTFLQAASSCCRYRGWLPGNTHLFGGWLYLDWLPRNA